MTNSGIFTTAAAALAAVATLSATAPAAAQSGDAAYEWVRKVQASRNNRLAISVTGNFSPDHGCNKPYWARSEFDFDEPQTQAMLQIALSSLLSHKPVHVYTSGCDNGYPILTQIQIQEREPESGGSTGTGSGSGPFPPFCELCEGPPESP